MSASDLIRVSKGDIAEKGDALQYKGVTLPPVESPADFIQFAEWSVVPRYKRDEFGEPTAVTEYAERYGVPRRTLYNWKNMPEFAELQEAITDSVMGDLVHQVIRTAGDVATTKDVRAQKDRQMLLQMAGKIVDRKQVEHRGDVTVTHDAARQMKLSDMRRNLFQQFRSDERLSHLSDDQIHAFVDGLLGASTGASPEETARALPSSSEEEVKRAQQRVLELPDGS